MVLMKLIKVEISTKETNSLLQNLSTSMFNDKRKTKLINYGSFIIKVVGG